MYRIQVIFEFVVNNAPGGPAHMGRAWVINQQKQMGRAGPIKLRAEPGQARKLRPVEARQHNLDLTILQLVN